MNIWIDQPTLSITVKHHCDHCYFSELHQDQIECCCFHWNEMNFSQSQTQVSRRSDQKHWTINIQLTDFENRKEFDSLSVKFHQSWNSWWNSEKLWSSILRVEEHWTSWSLDSFKKFSHLKAQALSAVHRHCKTQQWTCSSCRHDCSDNVTFQFSNNVWCFQENHCVLQH